MAVTINQISFDMDVVFTKGGVEYTAMVEMIEKKRGRVLVSDIGGSGKSFWIVERPFTSNEIGFNEIKLVPVLGC